MFEYIGMRKPILCVPSDGYELESLIKKHSLGYVFDDKEELKEQILSWIEKHKTSQWPASLDVDVSMFSRLSQSKKLFSLLNELKG